MPAPPMGTRPGRACVSSIRTVFDVRAKRIPQRTCVACRSVRGKREMIRVVHSPQGPVVVDDTGKRAGRGAYLCPQRSCWDRGLAQRQLEAALKIRLTPEDRETLGRYAEGLAS